MLSLFTISSDLLRIAISFYVNFPDRLLFLRLCPFYYHVLFINKITDIDRLDCDLLITTDAFTFSILCHKSLDRITILYLKMSISLQTSFAYYSVIITITSTKTVKNEQKANNIKHRLTTNCQHLNAITRYLS